LLEVSVVKARGLAGVEGPLEIPSPEKTLSVSPYILAWFVCVVSAAANSGSIALRKLLIDVAVDMSGFSLGNCGELSTTTGIGSFSGAGFLRRRKKDDFCFKAGRCGSSSGIGGGTTTFGFAEVAETVEAVSEVKNVGSSVLGFEGE